MFPPLTGGYASRIDWIYNKWSWGKWKTDVVKGEDIYLV